MATESMATLDAILKIDYLPVVQVQLNKDVILYARVKRDRENVAGKRFEFPAHGAWAESGGAIAELGALPTAGNEIVKSSFGTVKTIFQHLQISTKVISATKTDRAAFVQAVDFKMKAAVDNLKRDLNTMLNGDGTGALARVTAVSGQDITVDNALPLRPNMVLNAWTARSGGTQHNADFTVSNINYETNVVTVVGTISAVAPNDWLFKSTGRGLNVMGLLGAVDDGTYVVTFQGIDRSTDGWWKSVVLGNGGVARPLTFSLLQALEDKIYIQSGARPSMIYSNLGQRNAYLQLAIADKRYVNTMKYDAGFEALEYNGRPWFVDRDTPKDLIYMCDEEVLRFFVMKDIGWMDEDGAILHRSGTNLSYLATLEGHMEFGTYQPNRHGVLRDLEVPAGY